MQILEKLSSLGADKAAGLGPMLLTHAPLVVSGVLVVGIAAQLASLVWRILAPPAEGERRFVELDGVFYQADVWLDGAYLGDPEGYFIAFDLQAGDFLWNFQCGSGHHGSPITYELDGKQYVAVCVGWGGPSAKYRDGAPWFAHIPNGCAVYVFALPD